MSRKRLGQTQGERPTEVGPPGLGPSGQVVPIVSIRDRQSSPTQGEIQAYYDNAGINLVHPEPGHSRFRYGIQIHQGLTIVPEKPLQMGPQSI